MSSIIKFDPDMVCERLHGLSAKCRLAFGVLVLERAIPNFLKFAAETEAPGCVMLRQAQAKLWSVLEGGDGCLHFGNVTAQTCEVFAPDTELYDSPYTSAALDAITITCNLLDYVETERIDLLVEAASLRRDTVYVFLQVAEQFDSDDSEIHPLVQQELRFQSDDLLFLEQWRSRDSELWSAVLERSIDLGYSYFRMASASLD